MTTIEALGAAESESAPPTLTTSCVKVPAWCTDIDERPRRSRYLTSNEHAIRWAASWHWARSMSRQRPRQICDRDLDAMVSWMLDDHGDVGTEWVDVDGRRVGFCVDAGAVLQLFPGSLFVHDLMTEWSQRGIAFGDGLPRVGDLGS